MRLSARTVGLLAAFITVAIWTAFILIARASAQRSLAPLDIAWLRVLGASMVLVPWGWWLVRRRNAGAGVRAVLPSSLGGISPLPLHLTLQLGLFGGVVYCLLAYSGFFYAPATHASVLMPGSLPLWTTLLAVFLLRERITRLRATGLALIVLGDLLVGGSSLLTALGGGDVWRGDVLFMAASVCWACYSVLARRCGADAVQATIAITAFALFTYVPVYAILAGAGWVSSQLAHAPWREIIFQMLFQGVGSVVISGITFTHMVQYFGPVRSTMITALVPGLSAMGAVWLLNEPLHWNLVAGLLLVTLGIFFGVLGVRTAPTTTTGQVTRA